MMKPVITLTLNPCLDLVCHVGRVEPDRKLRTGDPAYEPGGGGINVSRAINRMNGPTKAIYLAGGSVGKMLEDQLDHEQLDACRVAVNGRTRINPNVFENDSDRLYRFILPGPAWDQSAEAPLLKSVRQALADADYLVISGSLPQGMPDHAYQRIIAEAGRRAVRTIVDTSGHALEKAVDQGVYLIKPNLRELGGLTGRQLDNEQQIIDAAGAILSDKPVEVVLVSLGKGGAMLVTHESASHLRSPTVKIRSNVGAGDSLVAGIALALAQGMTLSEAARYGIAAGAAAVMTPGTELCRGTDVDRLYNEMKSHDAPEHSDD
jgi:6-phosphofructokinase 2